MLLLLCLVPLPSYAQTDTDDLSLAHQYFEDLKYEEAISAYKRAYKNVAGEAACRGLVKSHLELGLQYQFNGRNTESQTQFAMGLTYAETLIKLNPTHPEHRLLRGLLYVYNRLFEKARSDFEYVRNHYPTNGQVYHYLWILEPLQGQEKIDHPYVAKAFALDSGLYVLNQELGSFYNSLGITDQAIANYERAISLSPKNYKAHFALGQVYWNTGNLDKMRYHFEQSLVYFPNFGYAQMLLAGVELMSANTTVAIDLIKVALKNNPQTENYLNMYQENFPVLNNYNFKPKTVADNTAIDAKGFPRYYQEALSLAQAYDFYSAVDKFHQCYDSYQNYDQRQVAWTISILSWTAHCYRELGLYANAIGVSKQALDLAVTHQVTTDQASLAANIGMIYFGWGDYPKAIAYAKQSLDYLIQFDQQEQHYDAYINLGAYYRKWQKNDSAVYCHQRALELSKDQEGLKEIIAYKELALSHNASGQMTLAKENIDLMFDRSQQVDIQGQEPVIYLGAAQVYYSFGDYQKAYDYCNQATNHFIELQQVAPIHPSLIDFASTFSGILANVDQIELAHTNLESLNNLLINQIKYNFPAMSDQGKLVFYREASEYFERYNSFSLTHTIVNEYVLKRMLENQLLKKGLLFNDASRFNRLLSKTDNPEASKLYKQLVANKNLMARSITLTQSELSSRGIDKPSLQREIDSLQAAIGQLGIASEQSKTYEENLAERIHSQLASNEAAIEIIRFRSYDFNKGGQFTDQVYYLALIQKGNTEVIEYVILGQGDQLESKGYKLYSQAIKYEVADEESYATYWEPIQEKLSGIDKIYLAGDGVYHKININTLFNPVKKTYLIDELDIRLVTSTRDVLKKTPKLPKSGEVYLVGFPSFETDAKEEIQENVPLFATRAFTNWEDLPPLPGTYTEVKAIEKILEKSKWRTSILTGDQAIEENIKTITNPTILHIATHGYFEESKQYDNALLYSGLFLTGAITNYRNRSTSGEDGILTAYEAMHLDLQETQMVVLSACETGMGRIENGEGVYGLQRAFLIAGASSVVMSMWNVNDQTTMELMRSFYTILEQSKDKHVAFRKAQLDLKEKHSSPKYWGAFSIVGK